MPSLYHLYHPLVCPLELPKLHWAIQANVRLVGGLWGGVAFPGGWFFFCEDGLPRPWYRHNGLLYFGNDLLPISVI